MILFLIVPNVYILMVVEDRSRSAIRMKVFLKAVSYLWCSPHQYRNATRALALHLKNSRFILSLSGHENELETVHFRWSFSIAIDSQSH